MEGYSELIEVIGVGAYGKVYKAVQLSTDSTVAVKVIDTTIDDGDAELEVRLMRSLPAHENLVNLLDSQRGAHGHLYLALEFLLCSAIEYVRYLGTDTRISQSCLASIMYDCLNGLQVLHDHRLIHRDIKGANILLSSDGTAKLGDFGVSRERSGATTGGAKTVIGSPYWMAPEVVLETGYTCSADIWGLGITGIELVDKQPPLAHVHPMRVLFMLPSKPAPRLTDASGGAFGELNSLLALMLQKKPENRSSASQLLKHKWLKKRKRSAISAQLAAYEPEESSFSSEESVGDYEDGETLSSDTSVYDGLADLAALNTVILKEGETTWRRPGEVQVEIEDGGKFTIRKKRHRFLPKLRSVFKRNSKGSAKTTGKTSDPKRTLNFGRAPAAEQAVANDVSADPQELVQERGTFPNQRSVKSSTSHNRHSSTAPKKSVIGKPISWKSILLNVLICICVVLPSVQYGLNADKVFSTIISFACLFVFNRPGAAAALFIRTAGVQLYYLWLSYTLPDVPVTLASWWNGSLPSQTHSDVWPARISSVAGNLAATLFVYFSAS